MNDQSNAIEDDLSAVLGQAQPRGAGFSERMAAGAEQKRKSHSARRVVVFTGLAALAAVVFLLWLPSRDSSKVTENLVEQPLVEKPLVEQPLVEQPLPAGGIAVPSGPVLLVFDVQPEGEVFVDGTSVGSTRKPIEVASGKRRIEVKINSVVKIRWKGELLDGQWKRFAFTAPVAVSPSVKRLATKKENRVQRSTPSDVIDPFRSDNDTLHSPFDSDWDSSLNFPDWNKSSKRSKAGRNGSLLIASKPWGKVYIDGRLVGNSPVRFTLAPGRHTISIKRKGYQSVRRSVSIVAGKVSKLVMRMKKHDDTSVISPFE